MYDVLLTLFVAIVPAVSVTAKGQTHNTYWANMLRSHASWLAVCLRNNA